MKRLAVGVAIWISVVAAMAAQTTKYGVKVTAEKGVDFATFKTYSWTQGQPSANKTINQTIVAAVDRELSALGMAKVAGEPGDVLATYGSLTRTDVNLKPKADSKGLQPEISVGTLIVALLDPQSRKRLLQMRIDQPIDTEPTKLEASINSAVAAMFAEYPTRRRK